ncbi:hypothetical protein [Ohtaekwangia sp.]|uniref:hypothetical protein n=1 Tax=Ohtaekwangia sp. TaxID=2066019 RepID=UPI002FDD37AC
MPRLYIALVSVLLFCCNTHQPTDRSDKNAFYFWQTSLYNFSWNDSTYKALHVSKLYTRLFDVDWSETAQAAVPVFEEQKENKAKILYMITVLSKSQDVRAYALQYEKFSDTDFYARRNCLTLKDMATGNL